MKRWYLFLMCGVLLVLYAFYVYAPSVFFNNPERLSYLNYTAAFREIVFVLSLLFFVGVIGIFSYPSETKNLAASGYKYWSFSFFGLILPLIILIVFINPHGIFPWQYFTTVDIATVLPTAARSKKIELYRELEHPPEVVIMGSSRAFNISSAYVKQSIGYSTFNMAINGGSLSDFSPFEELIFSEQADSPPVLFIVELLKPDFKVSEAILPISLIPYLSSSRGYSTVSNAFHDVVSFQAVSDVFFQLSYARFYPKEPAMLFKPDGSGVRKDVTREGYDAALGILATDNDERYMCDELNKEGVMQFEMLVQLADENETAILFYRSPLNADYLDIAALDHPLYQECEELFLSYMSNMEEEHANVFFRDLTYYEPISSLRWDGYYDIHHLKPIAVQMLVDVLAPDIRKAAIWALEERR